MFSTDGTVSVVDPATWKTKTVLQVSPIYIYIINNCTDQLLTTLSMKIVLVNEYKICLEHFEYGSRNIHTKLSSGMHKLIKLDEQSIFLQSCSKWQPLL